MEVKINEIAIPEKIVWNFDEIKGYVAELVAEYEITIYSEDQIKEAKADRAALNKLKKALNDERIRREKEYMKPFAEFKGQVAEVISIIDKPLGLIDEQVKAFEDRRREEKEEEIKNLLKTFELPYGIDPQRIFDTSWLNASVSMRTVQNEIADLVQSVKDDIKTLEDLKEDKEVAIACYVDTLSLRLAMQKVREQQDERERQEKIRQMLEKQNQEKKPDNRDEIQESERPPVTVKEDGRWIEFKAYLTQSQALELKRFFNSRGIQYGPVERGK